MKWDCEERKCINRNVRTAILEEGWNKKRRAVSVIYMGMSGLECQNQKIPKENRNKKIIFEKGILKKNPTKKC